MSSVAKGTRRETSAGRQLAALGYRWAKLSQSGKARADDKNRLRFDLIAWAAPHSRLPHVVAEIGGEKKSVTAAFKALLEAPLPGGHVALVGRVVRRRWRWHSSPARGDGHDSLLAAIEARG